jgi:hypothetical protein
MIIGWSFALIIDWKLNVDDVPQTIAIVAVLLAIGLYKRKKRLGAAF